MNKPKSKDEFDEWLSGYADIRLLKFKEVRKPFLEIILHAADAAKVSELLGIHPPLITSSAGYDYPAFEVGFFRHIPEAEKAVELEKTAEFKGAKEILKHIRNELNDLSEHYHRDDSKRVDYLRSDEVYGVINSAEGLIDAESLRLRSDKEGVN